MKQNANITPELLEKCVQDDRKAIQILYEYCFGFLMPVCFRYHSHEEDARASFNLGFMKILKSLDGLKPEVNFPGWSKRIMVNTLIDEYRKASNYHGKVSSRENDWELENQGSAHENDGEQAFGYELIIKLVNELPEVTGKVFLLYVVEGYQHKEIAEMFTMSEGTSKWHLSTARKMLREKLEKLDQELTNGRGKQLVI